MKLIKRDKENDKVQNMSLLSVLFPYIFRLVLFPPNIFGGLHDSTKLGAFTARCIPFLIPTTTLVILFYYCCFDETPLLFICIAAAAAALLLSASIINN